MPLPYDSFGMSMPCGMISALRCDRLHIQCILDSMPEAVVNIVIEYRWMDTHLVLATEPDYSPRRIPDDVYNVVTYGMVIEYGLADHLTIAYASEAESDLESCDVFRFYTSCGPLHYAKNGWYDAFEVFAKHANSERHRWDIYKNDKFIKSLMFYPPDDVKYYMKLLDAALSIDDYGYSEDSVLSEWLDETKDARPEFVLAALRVYFACFERLYHVDVSFRKNFPMLSDEQYADMRREFGEESESDEEPDEESDEV